MNRGILFVISGPSGVGKGTIREKALERLDRIKFSVSCTTRVPRGTEENGVNYHFISKEEFQARLDNSEFLEYAAVHGDMYGTLRSGVERELEAGNDVLLEIDVQGAFQIREKMPCVLIFVLPPSREELIERLRHRGTESEEKINVRLKNAEEEMRHAGKYDHIIVNDDLARAALELKDTILEYRKIAEKNGG